MNLQVIMDESTKKILVLIFLSVMLSVGGQLLMKNGMKIVGQISLAQIIMPPTLFQVILNPYIIAGVGLYVFASVVWLVVLSRAELSYAYPMIGMSYIITSVLAWIIFKENMTALRFLGIISIISGVYLISLKK